MDIHSLAVQVQGMVEERLTAQGIQLVDFSCNRQGKDVFVRVIIDLPAGGISMGEIARVNRELGDLFEERGVFSSSYVVEVFSPGLDRPLRTTNDFVRCAGKKARFFLNQPVEGRIEWEGVIKGADGTSVFVSLPQGEVTIPLAAINKSKQVLE